MLLRRCLAVTFAVAVAACGPASGPPEPKLDTPDQKAIYAIGLLIAERVEGFALTEAELPIFESGLRDGVLNRPTKLDPGTMESQIQEFATARISAHSEAEKAASASYLATMAAESGATTAPSGYVVRTLSEGTGASPGPDDTVVVNYHGTLRDGSVFDSSVSRGTPAEFPVGRVIACWTQALQSMKTGGKYKLTCPSNVAYGDRGSPPVIKPGATLTFEMELLEVKPAAAAPNATGGHP